jgi:hypothetical protein
MNLPTIKEKILQRVKKKYGSLACDLVRNYQSQPETSVASIAEIMGVSRQTVSLLLCRLYGSNRKLTLKARCGVATNSAYISEIYAALHSHGVLFRKEKGGIHILPNEATFVIRRFQKFHTPHQTYIQHWKIDTEVDFVVGSFEGDIYVVPFKKSARGKPYFRPEVFETYKNAFFNLSSKTSPLNPESKG